jgi:hypothetical protein
MLHYQDGSHIKLNKMLDIEAILFQFLVIVFDAI